MRIKTMSRTRLLVATVAAILLFCLSVPAQAADRVTVFAAASLANAITDLGNLFAGLGACLVADTYTTAWAVDIQIEDPLASMANAYTKIYLNISIDIMLEQLIGLMERFSADGLVMHSNRSCKPYSLGQYDLARAVTERTGKPALIIEADMTDSRVYAEAQVRERVEAFIESLA